MNNPFSELIDKFDGFEFEIGFRDNEDHFIGGTGNTVWYLIQKNRLTDCRIAEFDGINWKDVHIIKNKSVTKYDEKPGSTIKMILERAYFKQSEITESGRKAVLTEICGYKCSHYSFSFGARAYDVLNEYGITIQYSNIDDVASGYRLRNIFTGINVKKPEFNK